MIRITGGEFRSRLLETPNTDLTKPTMDKVRAAVFSAISNDKIDKVLDLFAGSGSYGFEAISRGAKSATFVDKSVQSIQVLHRNSQNLNLSNCEIIKENVATYLENLYEKFDCIFVDPPYKFDVYNKVINFIIEHDLLTSNGIIVLESDKELNIDKTLFKEVRDYRYGITRIYIIRK